MPQVQRPFTVELTSLYSKEKIQSMKNGDTNAAQENWLASFFDICS